MMLKNNQRSIILSMMLMMLLTATSTSSARLPSLKLAQRQQAEAREQRQFFGFRISTSTSCQLATVTSTRDRTEFSTCAQLVNVTGACSVRRGRFVEEPVVMSFDDGMDGLDNLLTPTETFR